MKSFIAPLTAMLMLAAPAAMADEPRYDVKVGQDTPVEVAMIDFTAFAPGADLNDFYEVNTHLNGQEVIKSGEVYYVVATHRFLES